MKKLALATVFILLIFACQKNDPDPEGEFECIEKKITAYKANKIPCETGKSIYRYKFQGEIVYVFHPGDCGADMMSMVYDSECDEICGLGGIAGNAICNGDNFGQNATEETLIWKN